MSTEATLPRQFFVIIVKCLSKASSSSLSQSVVYLEGLLLLWTEICIFSIPFSAVVRFLSRVTFNVNVTCASSLCKHGFLCTVKLSFSTFAS